MEERQRTLLVKQNPWWQGGAVETPSFERDMFRVLWRHLNRKQIIALVGLRRVGKTVLMRQVIRRLDAPPINICYISFDDIDFQRYETAEELINYFLGFSDKNTTRYLFLDEIQKLPNWADLLKTYYDADEKLKIFVTGSASLDLGKQKETLAGRILSFHLPPLSFSEFARYFGMVHEADPDSLIRVYDIEFAQKKEKYVALFRDYMTRGGFPELLEEKDPEFIARYIKESVIEKSISDTARASGGSERTIYELLRLLAASSAQLFEITNIAKTLKINRNLASSYINLLEKAFLIKTSYNFTASVAKQVRASKKQYCTHSCIAMALLGYPPEILDTEVGGRLAESVIASSMEKISFWRSPQRDEVDIVTERRMPVEVKHKSQIDNKDMLPILKFCRKFGTKKGLILTKDVLETRSVGGKEIMLIPEWLFLLSYAKNKQL